MRTDSISLFYRDFNIALLRQRVRNTRKAMAVGYADAPRDFYEVLERRARREALTRAFDRAFDQLYRFAKGI